jgi:predicted GH43/DUF377 family glycosyl hydrolase
MVEACVEAFNATRDQTWFENAVWILQPEDPWEVTGYVSNVVFTCDAVPETDGTVKIYWGNADTVICAGTAVIEDIVALCLSDSRPAM